LHRFARLRLERAATRFVLRADANMPGVTALAFQSDSRFWVLAPSMGPRNLRLNSCSDRHSAQPFYNIGGGMANSVSLLELTKFCQEFSGNRVEIGQIAETRNADIPFLCQRLHGYTRGRRLEAPA
jgi:hypothetical protein